MTPTTCNRTHKLGYVSRAAADEVARRIHRRKRTKKRVADTTRTEGVKVYRCEFCGMWHLGRRYR